jgi:hypothetical protein
MKVAFQSASERLGTTRAFFSFFSRMVVVITARCCVTIKSSGTRVELKDPYLTKASG